MAAKSITVERHERTVFRRGEDKEFFTVVKATNVLTPAVGTDLAPVEVNALIEGGTTVNIVPGKKKR